MRSVEAPGTNVVNLSSGLTLTVGEMVAKYSLAGSPGNDTITGRIVIGQVGDRGIYEDTEAGLVLVHISSAVVREGQMTYAAGLSSMTGMAPNLDIKSNTSFEYDHAIALLGLIPTPYEVPEALDRLTDNAQFNDSYEWHASVTNLSTYRALQRALRIASGCVEINIPVNDHIPATHPERRADCMLAVGQLGMDGFMVMPPNKPK